MDKMPIEDQMDAEFINNHTPDEMLEMMNNKPTTITMNEIVKRIAERIDVRQSLLIEQEQARDKYGAIGNTIAHDCRTVAIAYLENEIHFLQNLLQ